MRKVLLFEGLNLLLRRFGLVVNQIQGSNFRLDIGQVLLEGLDFFLGRLCLVVNQLEGSDF